jgi:hypothetical protein
MAQTLEDFAMSLRSVQNGKVRYHNRIYSAKELVNWNGDLVLVSTVPGATDRVRVKQDGGPEICIAYEEPST